MKTLFRLLLLTVLCLAVISPPIRAASSSDSQEAPLKRLTFQQNGKLRQAYLYTPSKYQAGQVIPVLLVFHGYLGTASEMMKTTDFNALAEREGFMVIYPETLRYRDRWNAATGVSDSGTEDLQFVQTLIKLVRSMRNVDSKRIYATGFSSGGFMTQRLACEMSDQVAAFAPVSATMGAELKQKCRPGRPIPILMINGATDPIVTWDGHIRRVRYAFKDARILTVPQTVAFWQEQNRCRPQPLPQTLRNTTGDPTSVIISQFPGCQPPAEVTQIIVGDGGHTWPGATTKSALLRPVLGNLNQEFKASETIWTFFKRHPLP